ncbi:FAD-dependent oxidoreductase [Pelomyxa schiedti]|nr:FAD-dependent oxidoreductase [Pelomyxa schiedti]
MACRLAAWVVCLVALASCSVAGNAVDDGDNVECNVVIAGGTTSALAAAISAASEISGVCLLEPTDWLGGQTTISVPAIDFAWHTVTDGNQSLPVYKYARDPSNLPPIFNTIVKKIGSPGHCWVSTNCFPPQLFLDYVQPYLAQVASNLSIFYNTVVKSVQTYSTESGKGISSLTAITRTPANGVVCSGYDRPLSQDVEDWYSLEDSSRFSKKVRTFTGDIFVDATEWGELLPLSGADYLQGLSEQYDGDISGQGDDTCGQSSTYCFAEEVHGVPVYEQPDPYPVDHADYYSLEGYTWDSVWTYRRLYGSASVAAAGDVSLQNWGSGNDNSFAYTFISRSDAALQVADWKGGVNLDTLETGENLAFGWHYWFKNESKNNGRDPDTVTLATQIFGTCHGLSKVPYLRDTRRAIGLNGFLMNISTISGTVSQVTGYPFPDRVAIGAYDVDIHGIKGCTYPSYMQVYYPILPYFIPFRALTSQSITNLLVCGKVMAQTFLVNAATRLHPIEWSSGAAAGAAAGFMASNNIQSTASVWDTPSLLAGVQQTAAKYTPSSWLIEGVYYPVS